MGKLRIVTSKGNTKEQAIANSGLSDILDVKFDATQAWKKEGTPDGATTYFKAFAEDYAKKKVKGIEGIGFTVTVEPGVADSRERPYKVTNHPTDAARKYTTFYEGLIDGNLEGTTGTIVFKADDKADAEKKAKQYMTDYRDSRVVVRLVKLVTEGKPVALVVDYAPSAGATLGTYIVFGYEREAA
jgi:hypothetical protein